LDGLLLSVGFRRLQFVSRCHDNERKHDSMPNPHVILPSRIVIAWTSDSEADVEPSQIVTFK
jgi:hypothetical protein